MTELAQAITLPERLAAAWPADAWRGVHVLLAVSGGADSMALLRAAAEVKHAAGGAGRLSAGHVNHGLRGEQSDADEAWLRDQCAQLGLPLEVRRCDTACLAAAEGDGVEAAARNARYRILTEMAEAQGARFIATAHTRDDQVETVLFRLLRGTGLRGLAGMPRTRQLSPAISLVRPLLRCSRGEVLGYLHSIDQAYREDATNRDLRFARNRIRQELLPYLRKHFNAEVGDAVARAAGAAAESQQLVDSLAQALWERSRVGGASAGEILLNVAPLADQPDVLVRETLRVAWRESGFGEQAMANRHWRQLAELAQKAAPGASLVLPGGIRAVREEGVGGLLRLVRLPAV